MKALNYLKIIILLLPGFGLILFFLGMILYVALFQSFGFFNLSGEDNFTIQYWQKLFNKKVFYRSINYSLYVGIISSIISVVLAYPIALWLRKPFYGSILINSILKAPLLVHGLVAAFLYVNLVAYHGIINQIFIAIGAWDEPIRMQNDKNAIGVLILQVWKNLPFALLILLGSIQSIGDDIIDAARDLGANSFERLKKINWESYYKSWPFNESALALYEWAPISEELKILDKKIVLNSMILKWDNIKEELAKLIKI